jgi:hypothetical protein
VKDPNSMTRDELVAAVSDLVDRRAKLVAALVCPDCGEALPRSSDEGEECPGCGLDPGIELEHGPDVARPPHPARIEFELDEGWFPGRRVFVRYDPVGGTALFADATRLVDGRVAAEPGLLRHQVEALVATLYRRGEYHTSMDSMAYLEECLARARS